MAAAMSAVAMIS